jgi:hypothetical protein
MMQVHPICVIYKPPIAHASAAPLLPAKHDAAGHVKFFRANARASCSERDTIMLHPRAEDDQVP